MRRRVVLIEGSGIQGQDKLPGAETDMLNWKLFLHSVYGGAWPNSNFTHLVNPNPTQVINAICDSDVDYLMVIFSGHGFCRKCDHEDFICLNPNACGLVDLEVSKIENLMRQHAEKGTLIIDACRGEEDVPDVGVSVTVSKYPFDKKSESRSLFCRKKVSLPDINEGRNVVRGVRSSSSKKISAAVVHPFWAKIVNEDNHRFKERHCHRRSAYRRLWMKWIRNFDNHFVTMKACAVSESAGEYDFVQDGRSGGYFTSALLDAAAYWKNKQKIPRMVYSTLDAFNDAVDLMYDLQQNPEYYPLDEEHVFSLS